MRVCFFGTYEQPYVRNRTLIDGLRQQGWQVQECHVPLWERERNKTGRYLGVVSLFLRGLELALAYVRLIVQYVFTVRSYDLMIVGYIGHLDMPLAWLLTRFPRRPLVFSPLISLYDTLVDDRKAFRDGSVMSRFLLWLDRWTCRMADLVLLDTNAHIAYFVDTFGLPREKFVRVFVGANEQVFTPRLRTRAYGEFHVIFVGKFTPLHGLEVMMQAARLLRDEPDIVFHFVGAGQLSERIRGIAGELGLPNVRFLDWVDYEQVPDRLAQADVCLGIFGTTAKAGRVIPGKVYEAISLGKPVVTSDTVAIRELLTDGESAVLCERGSPEALSRAILRLSRDRALLDRIGEGGRRVYLERASEAEIGRTAAGAMVSLVNR
jgi:glycosyltransferase involved in cell wall biosynthesis